MAEGFEAPIRTTPVNRDYVIDYECVLGAGSYGEVYKCEAVADGRRTGQIFAAKITDFTAKAKQEAALQMQCEHANVVKVFALYENTLKTPADIKNHRPYRKCLIMVMEYMAGGELFKRILEKKRFTERDASMIMQRIASAVAHMHNMNIAHRDLKPENFLLPRVDSPDYEVKVADFGFAKFGPGSTPLGSGFYTSPNKVQSIVDRRTLTSQLAPSTFNNDCHCDTWSLGVILFVMLVGYPPFRPTRKDGNIHNDRRLQDQILRGDYSLDHPKWEGISDEAKGLVKRLMDMNSLTRMTAQELLQHPWVTRTSELSDRALMSPGAIGAVMQSGEAAQSIREDATFMRGDRDVEGAAMPSPADLKKMSKLKKEAKAAAVASAVPAVVPAAVAAATTTTTTTTVAAAPVPAFTPTAAPAVTPATAPVPTPTSASPAPDTSNDKAVSNTAMQGISAAPTATAAAPSVPAAAAAAAAVAEPLTGETAAMSAIADAVTSAYESARATPVPSVALPMDTQVTPASSSSMQV